ncbi:hypothetical protein POM88_041279 [Heracleum sosnowskyi]|uniref:Uncharacterized protein n=1 Tax=Heracleum sosnowskyi TaxID=360622 RepID=A0AAD8MB83_9APIA|nr:hypothetical protein POM88_041279 [Heracleum sosnowskyi]
MSNWSSDKLLDWQSRTCNLRNLCLENLKGELSTVEAEDSSIYNEIEDLKRTYLKDSCQLESDLELLECTVALRNIRRDAIKSYDKLEKEKKLSGDDVKDLSSDLQAFMLIFCVLCISKNSYFIFEMLKAFEPPLDLSQDLDICEQDPQNILDNTKETKYFSCGSASTSKRGCHPGCNEALGGEEGSVLLGSHKQEEKLGLCIESDNGSGHILESDTKVDKVGNNGVKIQKTRM